MRTRVRDRNSARHPNGKHMSTGQQALPIPFPDVEMQFEGFDNLMPHRVQNILLVSSLYDSFILREDGRLNELLVSESQDLHLQQIPRITHVASGREVGSVDAPLLYSWDGTQRIRSIGGVRGPGQVHALRGQLGPLPGGDRPPYGPGQQGARR